MAPYPYPEALDVRYLCRRERDFVPVVIGGTHMAAHVSSLSRIAPTPEISAEDYIMGLMALGYTAEARGQYIWLREPGDDMPEWWDDRAYQLLRVWPGDRDAEAVGFLRLFNGPEDAPN